mgnify:CR=1 FL=1|jgi:hypothetical protein
MNESDIDMLDQQIRMATMGAATNQELRGINFLLQKILLGQAQINARLDDIQRTINPQKWERDHPEEDLTADMF